MNNFILLGITLGIIGEIYLVLIGCYLGYNDKIFVKIINKSIVRYYGIMVTGIISMVIGMFAN